ncbi:four helix bundle protein [bacterium]|nr:four helix bundle protein [bacterium]MBU1918953.1 four helix bundle protein [bacterium]
MKINSYKDLDIWKKGIEITSFIYKQMKNFPDSEKYGLCNQMRRAAVSIPSNIAEGFGRQYPKEFKQFCYIARGSCVELETLCYIANQQDYLSGKDYERLEELLNHEGRMLKNFIRTLR